MYDITRESDQSIHAVSSRALQNLIFFIFLLFRDVTLDYFEAKADYPDYSLNLSQDWHGVQGVIKFKDGCQKVSTESHPKKTFR